MEVIPGPALGEINQAVETKKLQASIHRPTMSSRLRKRKKNCRDSVMNLMEKLKNVRKKSRHCSTLSIILRSGTRTTEISSCKALKVLIWSANKSWKTSAELPVRIQAGSRSLAWRAGLDRPQPLPSHDLSRGLLSSLAILSELAGLMCSAAPKKR